MKRGECGDNNVSLPDNRELLPLLLSGEAVALLDRVRQKFSLVQGGTVVTGEKTPFLRYNVILAAGQPSHR